MSEFQFRNFLFSFVIVAAGVGVAFAQPPAADEKKKKEEPPTPEELALRQGSKDLVYKFVQGDEIHCQARRKRTEKRNVNETLSDESREIEFGLILTVAKTLPNGSAEFNAMVDWVTLDAKGRWPHKYDSRVKKENQDGEGWELHHKAKFSFKVDARGSVTDIKPDSETREYWQQQPRELKSLVTHDVVKSLLPFIALPTDLAAHRGTDWKEKRSLLDETFGTREVTLTFSYHGSETVRGNTYEDIRIRGEAKQKDEKPKYEIVEHTGSGSMSFDRRFGCLRTFRFDESYVFNPPGAKLVALPMSEKEKEAEEKKEKEMKKGKGGAGGGLGQGGMGGGGRGKGGGGGKGGQKKTKEERKKEEEEEKKRPKSKIVEIDLENEVRITYRGKPIAAQ